MLPSDPPLTNRPPVPGGIPHASASQRSVTRSTSAAPAPSSAVPAKSWRPAASVMAIVPAKLPAVGTVAKQRGWSWWMALPSTSRRTRSSSAGHGSPPAGSGSSTAARSTAGSERPAIGRSASVSECSTSRSTTACPSSRIVEASGWTGDGREGASA